MDWLWVTFVAMMAGLVAVGCQRPGDTEVGQTADGTVRLGPEVVTDTVRRAVAPGERRLVLDGFTGDVDLRGGEATTAELVFVKRGRGDDIDAAGDALAGVTVTESGTQEAYTFEMDADASDRAAVDVSGTVPRGTTLRIDHASGAVRLSGLTGAIDVQHQYGPVTIDGAAGPVDVAIQTGDVTVRFDAVPRTASVSLRTANGDVRLGLPGAASVQVDAETNAGAVRTQGLTFGPQRLTPLNAGARYTAQMGAGDAVVEIRTENGTITLEAVSDPATTPAAPADTARVDTAQVAPDARPEATPDTTAPDTIAPEPTAPEATAPETTAPEATAPETTGSDPSDAPEPRRRAPRPPSDTLRTPAGGTADTTQRR